MSCTHFIAQIYSVSGTWINVSGPEETYENANEKRVEYFGNPRSKGFRVLQSKCGERPKSIKTCCGK